ncbi:MAG: DUF5990 family protein [Nocardiopsaceae bacterium]|jgi:hypothetical protein|nr:DUF5990 family protein [Nocardiopsaceae bacterium]
MIAGKVMDTDALTDEDRELIAGQYADRQQLRPVLDAVLSAAASLDDVSVQARRTLVSLVSPRRTFAVLQPRTKHRLDMGLRLDGLEPRGRLLPARDLGASTVRIGLASLADVDAEAIGWLRRAYEESAAPPPPRKRPAPRPPAERRPLIVRIDGYDLPGRSCRPEPDGAGYKNVHVGVGDYRPHAEGLTVADRRWVATQLVPGDAESASWEFTVTIRRGDAIDFGGHSVRGDRSDRHLGLIWGEVPGDGTFRLFRGAKLRLVDVDQRIIERAWQPGFTLVARVRLTDGRGNPICARVRPPYIEWSAERIG